MQHILRSLQAFVVIRSGEMDRNSDTEYVTIPHSISSLIITNSQTLIAMGEGKVKGQQDRVCYYSILHLELKY